MNIVVTGSSGFLGRHLCSRLALTNNVLGVDIVECKERIGLWNHLSSDVTRWVDAPPGSDFLNGAGRMDRVDVVYHLAASPWQKTADSERIRNHVAGTLGACMLAGRYKARLILASSAQIYGRPEVSPQEEWHQPRPFEGYGWSKYLAEEVVRTYCTRAHLYHAICRFANLYGPGQPEGQAITDITLIFRRAVRTGAARVTLRGTGNETRDWVYVDDVVGAISRFVGAGDEGHVTYNVGTGVPTTMRDLAGGIALLVGFGGEIAFEGTPGIRDSEDEAPRALGIRAMTKLGWTPKVTLDEGLRWTVESIE